MNNSCIGCKYLYTKVIGYSCWTIISIDICCYKEKNTNLPCDKPCDWNGPNCDPAFDNWELTRNSRCSDYITGLHRDFNVEESPCPNNFE